MVTQRVRHLQKAIRKATHDGDRDEAARRLVGSFQDFDGRLSSVEHCQDIEELFACAVEIAAAALSSTEDRSRPSESWMDGVTRELERLLNERLPLPARNGPACRDCGLCKELDWPAPLHRIHVRS